MKTFIQFLRFILLSPLHILLGVSGAVPLGTMTTFALTGNREDISD